MGKWKEANRPSLLFCAVYYNFCILIILYNQIFDFKSRCTRAGKTAITKSSILAIFQQHYHSFHNHSSFGCHIPWLQVCLVHLYTLPFFFSNEWCTFCCAFILSLLSLPFLSLTGNNLYTAEAFTIYAIFTAMQFTVGTLPYGIKCLAEAKVSCNKIQVSNFT